MPSLDGPLGGLLARLNGGDNGGREGTLLGASAILSLYLRAGRSPEIDNQPLPEPCSPDDLPRCSPRAGQHLAMILNSQHPEVLPEWLAVVARAGQRAPEENLPFLLEKGQKQPGLRDAILPVLGKRGHWLAAQNSEWDYVAGGDNHEAIWQTGSRAARLSLLQKLRASDPARARALAASTWTKESPDDRAAFLAAFQALSDRLPLKLDPPGGYSLVTIHAKGNQVFRLVCPSLGPWEVMVDLHSLVALPAVLAGMLIPVKHRLAEIAVIFGEALLVLDPLDSRAFQLLCIDLGIFQHDLFNHTPG
ncbi:MAG: DUF5691 domain-containing protein [Firmicutes bacterium]|nr:DUF5691 domain-containing protein [Bacillota bacterium]